MLRGDDARVERIVVPSNLAALAHLVLDPSPLPLGDAVFCGGVRMNVEIRDRMQLAARRIGLAPLGVEELERALTVVRTSGYSSDS